MKLHRKLLWLSVIVIGLGLAGLLPFAYFSLQNKAALAAQTRVAVPAVAPKPAPTPSLAIGKPVRLQIPQLNIDLTVADGTYNPKNGSWTLSRDKAHYALPTMQPNNEQGNTLIYGHYRPEVFARLHKIATGAEAIVTTDNGLRFTYRFRTSETVNPANTGIFAYTGEPQLTLQTCSGAWMQNRQLYYFDFTGYTKQ